MYIYIYDMADIMEDFQVVAFKTMRLINAFISGLI